MYIIKSNGKYLCKLHDVQWWGCNQKYAKRFSKIQAQEVLAAMKDSFLVWAASLKMIKLVPCKINPKYIFNRRTCY